MLYELIVYLRAMQLFYHSCHNLTKGPLFFADHEAFGGFYSSLEKDYDDVVERAIPTEGEGVADPVKQIQEVYKILKEKNLTPVKENKDMFLKGLECEKHLCKLIDIKCKSGKISEGTRQLIGDIANASEVRQYKISQRLK